MTINLIFILCSISTIRIIFKMHNSISTENKSIRAVFFLYAVFRTQQGNLVLEHSVPIKILPFPTFRQLLKALGT